MKTHLSANWQTRYRAMQTLVALLLGLIPLLFELLLFNVVARIYVRIAAWRGYDQAAAAAILDASPAEKKLAVKPSDIGSLA
jgi:hypothetical protein